MAVSTFLLPAHPAALDGGLKKTEVAEAKTKDQTQSVFFKFVNGKTLCMLVNVHEDDIFTIKQRLVNLASVQEGTPSFVVASKDLFLVWNGKPLDEDCVLADYNLGYHKQHLTIMCQQRHRGGCFAVSFSVLIMIMACIVGSTCTCGASLIMVPLLLPLLLVLPLFCL